MHKPRASYQFTETKKISSCKLLCMRLAREERRKKKQAIYCILFSTKIIQKFMEA